MEELLLTGSIAQIQKALTSRQLSVPDIVDWYLSRTEQIDRAGPKLNAVRSLAADARDTALRLDEELTAGRCRGPLHGIPVLLKDNILARDGMTAAAGSAALADFEPKRDATLVRRLRQAGAIILGKTNLTEFADYVSDVMPSGFSGAGGYVKNPHNNEHYGRGLGSSVGSAAAVAAALVPVAIGSETQNSIQTPASVSGVFGFKPSVGMVSRAGLVPLVPSQDSPGPLTRSVEDAALVMSIIAGADCNDTATLGAVPPLSHPLAGAVTGCLRVGVPRRSIADRPELAPHLPRFESILQKLRDAGMAVTDPCDLPAAEQLHEVRSCVFRTEFKAALDAFLEANDHPCGIDCLQTLISWNTAHPEAIPFGQSLLIAAAATGGLDVAEYRSDRQRDIALSRQAGIDAALQFSGADILIAPMGAAAKCTGKAGAPVLAIPAGLGPTGLPFGVTLFTSFGGDAKLLAAGARVAAAIAERPVPRL
jgi:amidase